MTQHNIDLTKLLDRALAGLRDETTAHHRLEALCEHLYRLRAEVSPRQWKSIGALCRAHPIFPVLLSEPITSRGFAKPRGYAGDAKLMDLIYSVQPAAGLTRESGLVHSFLKGRPSLRGARARKLKLAALLHRTLDEVESPEILSVACGHMRESQLLSPSRLNRAKRFVALDQDEQSLHEVSRSMSECSALSIVPGSIRRLIAGREELGEFDLIYSLGLYDYLEQPVAARLTQVLFDSLKPGGRLVIANYLPVQDSAYMETFMEWDLIYRTPEEILEMASDVHMDQVSEKRYTEEHSGTIGFLELSKASAMSFAA